ncbi:MAG: hypothetical protein ACFFAN_06930 [Promethearchaeota archaeon]
MELTFLDYFNGILTLLVVLIEVIVWALMFNKYIRYHQKIILIMAFTLLIATTPYIAQSISFLLILITGEGLSPHLYFLIGIGIVPIAGLLAFYGITELVYQEKQKLVLSLFSIYLSIYYVIFFYFWFTDVSLIGTLDPVPINADFTPIISIFMAILIFIVPIPGIMFYKETRKAATKEIRLKGTLYLTSSIPFVAATFLSGLFSLTAITLLIARLLLFLSQIFVYFAFAMPNWLKKWISKKE